MLTKSELLAKKERRFDTVSLPSGGEVRVRSLKRSEQRQWRKSWINKKGDVDHGKLAYSDDALIALCLVDDKNDPMFSIKEAQDGCFDDMDAGDLNAILKGATKINNMGGDESGKTEAAIKNSEETPGKDSSGGSAEDTA